MIIVCFILVDMTSPLCVIYLLLEHSPSDCYFSCEWALLVDVVAGYRFLWSLESETDVSIVSKSFLDPRCCQVLLVHEDGWLL